MQRINVRIDDALRQQLEAEARLEGVRPSVIVRRALREHLDGKDPQPNAYDLAVKLGVLGSAPGLPPDLSTNPDHMEGFGG